MGTWWRRTDGQPGLSRYGSVTVGALAAVAGFTWLRFTSDGPVDGDLVGAIAGGVFVTFLARFDLRERGRRSGERDAERIRRWSKRLQDRRSRRTTDRP